MTATCDRILRKKISEILEGVVFEYAEFKRGFAGNLMASAESYGKAFVEAVDHIERLVLEAAEKQHLDVLDR